MRKMVLAACCLLAVPEAESSSGAPPSPTTKVRAEAGWVELGPMRVPEAADPAAAKRLRRDVHARLLADQAAEGSDTLLEVKLSARELAELEPGVCEGCAEEPFRLRVGLTQRVATAVTADLAGWGAMRETAHGGWVWSAAVRSEGAAGLRLRFREFRLPPDAELYLFNASGSVAGPYTGLGPLGKGEFWTNLVAGDTVSLQLRHPGPLGGAKLARPLFVLDAVGHVGSRFGAASAAAKAFCDYNAGCIVNLSCVDDTTAVDVARDAVAHMLFVDGEFLYACSGGLVNNTGGDGTPYFMTANHCLSTDDVAETLETFFKWTVGCGDECPFQWGTPTDAANVLGATVVATNRVGDYSLLRLSGESAPEGTALLGWTSKPVAFADEQRLHRVSHPAGAPQAYSEHSVDPDASTCLLWRRGPWIYSRDVVGATEGGSSGSPVVDDEGRMVGQLSGSCGFLAWLPCLSAWHATVDGAFASYFAEVSPWLAPPGGCADDADGDGFIAADCGGDDCDDDDFFVNPGAAEVCDNGIDDDCDGTADDDDPDCGICLPPGAACTRAADCCSRWCRWIGRTCR